MNTTTGSMGRFMPYGLSAELPAPTRFIIDRAAETSPMVVSAVHLSDKP